VDEQIMERPDAPDWPTPGRSAKTCEPGQTDIERADERKVGSVETVPQADPAAGVAGFIEPASDEPPEGPMPPHLEEG
jgi:hypothetical protein